VHVVIKKLGDVIDLVLVDYTVNDGMTMRVSLDKINLESTENNVLGRVEALTEYFINYIMKVKNKPALLYIENGSPQGHIDSLQAHYDAAKRHGIPMASMKHTASYPDDPSWVYFNSAPDYINPKGFRSINGYFHQDLNRNNEHLKDIKDKDKKDKGKDKIIELKPVLTLNGTMSRIPLIEGEPCLNSMGRREHKYISCWTMQHHPKHSAHYLIAQVVYYYLTVTSTRVNQQLLQICEEEKEKDNNKIVLKNKMLQYNPSEYATYFNKILNHFSICPYGVSMIYDSEIFYLRNRTIAGAMGNNKDSDWALIQDSPNKYGFIIEKSTGNKHKNTIYFNLKLSEQSVYTQITIEYMHTYENAGKVKITLLQQNKQDKDKEDKEDKKKNKKHKSSKDSEKKKTTIEIKDQLKQEEEEVEEKEDSIPYGSITLSPNDYLILDSYDSTTHNALYNEYKFYTKGYQLGQPAVLSVELLSLTSKEMMERKGNRFKLVAVSSC